MSEETIRPGQATALAIVAGRIGPLCPVCRRSRRFYIPDNGIGVVCEFCGAWSWVNPDPSIE